MNGARALLSKLGASPYFAAVTGIATLISTILAVYFYNASIQRRELVWTVSPQRTVVADPSSSSRLQVSFSGQRVTTRVSSLQLAMWNAGRQSIRPGDILEDITIVTNPRVPIYEARLQRTTRVICTIKLDAARAAAGELRVHWSILEQDDGAIVQLIYGGPADVNVNVRGAIEGQRNPTGVSYDAVKNQNKTGGVFGAILMSCFSLLGWIVGTVQVWRVAIQHEQSTLQRTIASLVVATVFLLGMYYAWTTLARDVWPQLVAPRMPFRF